MDDPWTKMLQQLRKRTSSLHRGIYYHFVSHCHSCSPSFSNFNRDISIKVLGYWWWWLFVVPSLRSRRPKGAEKKALDIAFLGTPIVSLLMPIATKDTAIIWAGK